MWLGLNEGQWPVLSGSWVYPAGAIIPMLAAAVGGAGGGSAYAGRLGADDHRARRGRGRVPPAHASARPSAGATDHDRRLVVARVPGAPRTGRDGPPRRRHRSRGRRRAVDRAEPPAHHLRAPDRRRVGQGRARRPADRAVRGGAPAVAQRRGAGGDRQRRGRRDRRGAGRAAPRGVVPDRAGGARAADRVARGHPVARRGTVLHVDHAVPERADRHLGDQGAGHAGRRGRARCALLPRARRGGAAALVAARAARCPDVVRRDRAHGAAGPRRDAADAGHARVQQGGVAAVHRLAGAARGGRARAAAARLADDRVADAGHRRRRRRWCSPGSTTRSSPAGPA